MCLAVPMQVVKREGDIAQCEAQGIGRQVSLFLLQHEDIGIGDHVMVHVGYAIQKISQTDAQSVWDMYDTMFMAESKAKAKAGSHA
ncbi:MAG: HypC/HybG/HupF family hydrogenase formation chaperone [Paracoccaceae bacterium]